MLVKKSLISLDLNLGIWKKLCVMKPTLLFATLSMVFAAPTAFAKSELETLRSLCQEQERQIRHLEDENTRLRSDNGSSREQQEAAAPILSAASKMQTIANPSPVVATTYTVKAGDSLEKIARATGTTPEKLAKSNGLKMNSVIQPGKKLKIPGTNASTTSSASPSNAATASPKTSQKTHTVQSGETFSSISRKHSVSAETLAAANPTVKATALRPGQVIKLPADAPSAPAHTQAQAQTPAPVEKSPASAPPTPAASEKAAAEKAAAEKAPPAAPIDKKLHPIAVDTEMTYGDFAAKHGTNTERLNALNGLDLTDATVLAKGSELYVPSQP